MDFYELASRRFSCRKFTDQPVEMEKLEKIMEAGILAPTARNQQPFHIFHMCSQEAKDAVRSCTKCHFGADNFLVIGGRKEDGWVRPFDGHSFSDVDAAIAATHMMLMVEQLGLATTWVGYFDAPALKEKCPQMDGWDLIAIFPIGYADEGPSPRHTERKKKAELVTEL